MPNSLQNRVKVLRLVAYALRIFEYYAHNEKIIAREKRRQLRSREPTYNTKEQLPYWLLTSITPLWHLAGDILFQWVMFRINVRILLG